MAKKYNAIVGNAKAAKDGYELTFIICYIRDMCIDYRSMGETIECTVPWSKIREFHKTLYESAEIIEKRRSLPKKTVYVKISN